MSYNSIIEENRAWIDGTFEKLDNKLSRIAKKSRHKIPYTTINGEHDDRRGSIDWWTNGFFGGLMWLMYEATKNEEYRITAEQKCRFQTIHCTPETDPGMGLVNQHIPI